MSGTDFDTVARRVKYDTEARDALARIQAENERLRQRCAFPSCVNGEKPPWCGNCGDAVRADAAEAENGRLREALRDAEMVIFEGVREDAPAVSACSWEEIQEDADEVRCAILNLLGIKTVDRTFPRLARLEHVQAEIERLRETRNQIERERRNAYDEADRADVEGAPVGTASYYRNMARGLGEALSILDTALKERV